MRLQLYFSPGTSARVPLIALEECAVPFETVLVKFAAGEHKSPDYLRLNPKGKVPTLLVDGRPLTENIAILGFLARSFPSAELLPLAGDAWSEAQVYADLSWCAATIHPIVTRIVLPMLFCDRPQGMQRAWEQAIEAIRGPFDLIEQRLQTRPWMFGHYSVVDAFVYWIWDQAAIGGFAGSAYPRIGEHAARVEQRPAVQRALAREHDALAWLEQNGLSVRLPPPPKDSK